MAYVSVSTTTKTQLALSRLLNYFSRGSSMLLAHTSVLFAWVPLFVYLFNNSSERRKKKKEQQDGGTTTSKHLL